MPVDRDFFVANFPKSKLNGRAMTPGRKEGFDAILDVWDATETESPLAGLAYALATAWHETGGTMQPVREGFKATDAEAVAHVTAYCQRQGIANYAARQSNGNSYYGRGYVQLTHADNYRKMGSQLGVGDALYDHPDDVMQPQTAARILLGGMIGGLFRPAKGKLADYFDGTTEDWFGARELINGDKDKTPAWAGGKSIGILIADYGQAFFAVLKQT
jgi:hypothetical protein